MQLAYLRPNSLLVYGLVLGRGQQALGIPPCDWYTKGNTTSISVFHKSQFLGLYPSKIEMFSRLWSPLARRRLALARALLLFLFNARYVESYPLCRDIAWILGLKMFLRTVLLAVSLDFWPLKKHFVLFSAWHNMCSLTSLFETRFNVVAFDGMVKRCSGLWILDLQSIRTILSRSIHGRVCGVLHLVLEYRVLLSSF